MSFRRFIIGLATLLLLLVGWIAFGTISTWRGIPDAYAAWDTGTLLIAYLEGHDNEWPQSWDQLLSTVENLDEHGEYLRGRDGEGGFIYGDLRNRVAIDWDVDPKAIVNAKWKDGELPIRVVTHADGRDFPTVWESAEPNGMIWRYLNKQDLD